MNVSRTEGVVQEEVGKVREAWGKVTDQPQLTAKGEFEQVMGQAKQLVGSVQHSVGAAVHKVRQDPKMEHADTRKAALVLLAYIAAALFLLSSIIGGRRNR